MNSFPDNTGKTINLDASTILGCTHINLVGIEESTHSISNTKQVMRTEQAMVAR